MSFGFGFFASKNVSKVWITVEYIDLHQQKKLQPHKFIQLNLSENLSKVRKRLEERDIIDSTLSFVKKFIKNGDSKFAEIAFEDEDSIRLNDIVCKSEDVRILNLTTCSKLDWKILNQSRKLDYGCTMTSDGIKKADKRAFDMKGCTLEELGNEECKTGEFKSKSSDDLMIDNNLFFDVNINVKYFVKLGIGMSLGTSDNNISHVEKNYSYHFIKYGKASLKLDFEHLEPTQEFIEVVEKAISSEDPVEQFKQITKDFGQFIPTEVILGGRIHYDESAKSIRLSTEISNEMSGKVNIKDLKIKGGNTSTSLEEKSNEYSYKYTKIIGGEQPDDFKNLDIGNWVGSLNNYKCWDCIEFRNPISIFQFLPEDLRKRIIRSVGITIHHSTIEKCELMLEEYRKPVQFRLSIPFEVKKIIKNENIDYKICATVTDITKAKNDFFTCQVLCPSNGILPSLIIHRVQKPLKLFKRRECKLRIGWMVIGYYRDFNFDFNTRLNIQLDAPDKDNPIEYDAKVPICLGIPVLSEYPKNESLIIGYYYYLQEERNKNSKINARTFAYCLKNERLEDLPKFTFYTLIITNYHTSDACDTIILKRKEYNNLNTASPKFISIYSTEQTNCLFLKQINGQVKLKKIGKYNKTKSVKCATFDPYLQKKQDNFPDMNLDRISQN